jgi:hypothetical protein
LLYGKKWNKVILREARCQALPRKSGTKTMTYQLTGGFEIETHGVAIPTIKAEFQRCGIKGCKVVPDGTPTVDAEIVTPVYANSQTAREHLISICDALARIGCRVNSKCGLHIHIGNAPLNDNVTPAQFTGTSIAHTERTGRYHTDHAEPFDAVIVKDIMVRYTRMQTSRNGINAMLPASRHNNRMCSVLDLNRLEAANNLSELTSATYGKFSSINLQTWSNGTIEFRQHSGTIEADKIWAWFQFLLNLVTHTLENRVTSGSRTIVRDTPTTPFRNGSRVGVQYTMMRVAGGASTRDIMDCTGCSEQRVRAAVSEIRTRVGDAAVITHTQQANGASYGSGTDYTSYEVQTTFTEQTSGATLLPDNSIGNASIWAGIPDEAFEWWQARIIALA